MGTETLTQASSKGYFQMQFLVDVGPIWCASTACLIKPLAINTRALGSKSTYIILLFFIFNAQMTKYLETLKGMHKYDKAIWQDHMTVRVLSWKKEKNP